jgi:hypothetical protein
MPVLVARGYDPIFNNLPVRSTVNIQFQSPLNALTLLQALGLLFLIPNFYFSIVDFKQYKY